MRFGFVGFCPLLLFSPLILFPLRTHMFASFLSCPPVFMSFHLILSFVCARSGPGLSVYVRNYIYFKPRFQVAQVFAMRWVFIVLSLCTWFPFITTTYTFVLSRPLVMSSFFCLSCARRCTCVLTLAFFAPPRVCV